MADAKAKSAFAGLNLADDLRDFESDIGASPPRPDRAKIEAVSERAGFPSREPVPRKPPPMERPLNYDARLTLRVTDADMKRFHDLVYRLRSSNGAVFQRLLDTFEASEK